MKAYDFKSEKNVDLGLVKHVKHLQVVITKPSKSSDYLDAPRATIGWKGTFKGEPIGAWMEVPIDDVKEIIHQLLQLQVLT